MDTVLSYSHSKTSQLKEGLATTRLLSKYLAQAGAYAGSQSPNQSKRR